MNPVKVIKKINNPLKLCFLVAATWLLLSTVLYFVELKFHGKILTSTESVNGVYTVYSTSHNLFHDSFSWTKMRFETMKLLNDDPVDPKETGEKWQWCILEPSFNLLGFLKLLLIPLLYIISLFFIIHFFIWDDRKYILDRVKQYVNQINPIAKLMILLSCAVLCLSVYLDILSESILVLLILAFIFVPMVWFILKKALGGLAYTIVKAINDAKK